MRGFRIWDNQRVWRGLLSGPVWAAKCARCGDWVAKYEETKELAELACLEHHCKEKDR